MTTTGSTALGMWLVAGLLAGVAIFGVVRGRFNPAFLAAAVVFVIIGIAARRRATTPGNQSTNREP